MYNLQRQLRALGKVGYCAGVGEGGWGRKGEKGMRLKFGCRNSVGGGGGSSEGVCSMHLRHRGFYRWTKDG